MPRKPKRGRLFQRPRTTPARAEALRLLLEPFALLAGTEHEALVGFTPEERTKLVQEAKREHWRRREAQREATLRERLRTWSPELHGLIFAERPDLEFERR